MTYWQRIKTVWIEAGPPGRMVIVLVIVVIAIVLAGCATTSTTIRVPVPVACDVATPPRPVMPTDTLTSADTLDRKVKAALAELETREGYEGKLRAALDVCTAPIAAK